jgi:hypothetical protein
VHEQAVCGRHEADSRLHVDLSDADIRDKMLILETRLA